MRLSRRDLIRAGVISAAATGPLGLAERAFAAVTPPRLARRMFSPHVGSAYALAAGRTTYTATLRSVGDLPHCGPGHPYRFRLMFTVRGVGPAQGTYVFRRRGAAPLALFVVPVGPGRTLYEAIVVSR